MADSKANLPQGGMPHNQKQTAAYDAMMVSNTLINPHPYHSQLGGYLVETLDFEGLVLPVF